MEGCRIPLYPQMAANGGQGIGKDGDHSKPGADSPAPGFEWSLILTSGCRIKLQ